MASSLAGLDVDGSGRQREFAREETDQLSVCGSSDRRCGDPDFERLAMDPDTSRVSSLGLDVNSEDGSLLTITDNQSRHGLAREYSWRDLSASCLLEDRLREFQNAALHVGIVGNRSGNRYVAGPLRGHALADQSAGVDKEPGAHTLL